MAITTPNPTTPTLVAKAQTRSRRLALLRKLAQMSRTCPDWQFSIRPYQPGDPADFLAAVYDDRIGKDQVYTNADYHALQAFLMIRLMDASQEGWGMGYEICEHEGQPAISVTFIDAEMEFICPFPQQVAYTGPDMGWNELDAIARLYPATWIYVDAQEGVGDE